MDLATLTGAPRDVDLAGVRYKVPPLKMRQWGAVQAWIKDNVPSPLALISSEDLASLNRIDKAALMREALDAQRAWPPRVGTRAWFEALDHPAKPAPDGSEAPSGSAVLLHAMLSPCQPAFDLAAAVALDARLTAAESMAAVLAAMGVPESPPKPQGAEATNPSP